MKYHLIKHLHLVNKHRYHVFINSLKVGIPIQGLLHDLSKYSFQEFIPSSKYYNGKFSPIANERLNEGLYSKIFTHHTNHNKHHFEHYIDIYKGDLILIKMPYKYSLEHVIDMISASQSYLKKDFKKDEPLKYFEKYKSTSLMHSMNIQFVETLLKNYALYGFKGIKYKNTKKIYKELDSKYPNTEIIKCFSLNNKFERVLLGKETIEKYK